MTATLDSFSRDATECIKECDYIDEHQHCGICGLRILLADGLPDDAHYCPEKHVDFSGRRMALHDKCGEFCPDCARKAQSDDDPEHLVWAVNAEIKRLDPLVRGLDHARRRALAKEIGEAATTITRLALDLAISEGLLGEHAA